MKMTYKQLQELQALSVQEKIYKSSCAIQEWYETWKGKIYVSLSGKDSTVLLDLVRNIYPEVPAVFINTGLEYPEIIRFIKTKENVTILRPKMNFRKVIEKYGYPVISKENSQKIHEIRNTKSKKLLHKRLHGADNSWKSGKLPEKWKYIINSPFKISHKCCDIMKKNPIHIYEKKSENYPILGTLAEDSLFRTQHYLRTGCNSFDTKRPTSKPISFWTTKDIWEYITKFNLTYPTIYDKGYKFTGCMFCMFGIHLEDYPNRFQRMKKTHPKHWKYCIYKLGIGEILDYIDIPYN